MTKQTYTVPAADGTRVPLRCWDSDPAGSTVVIVPALGTPAGRYDRVAAGLAGAGHHVLALDLRGVGDSPVRPARDVDFGYEEIVRYDLAAAVSEALRLWPASPVVLLGHSLGGQLAALHAVASPEQVSGLVLAASGSVYWRAFTLPMGAALAAFAVMAKGLARARGTFPGHWFRFGRTEARGLIGDWAHVGLTGRWEPRGAQRDYEALLGRTRLPVLSVTFDRDPYCPPGSAGHLAGKLAAARLTRDRITSDEMGTRADHYAWMREPEVFVARVSSWLADQDLTRSSVTPP